MQALWLEERRLTLRDVPEPDPPPGEAVVRVTCAGVCSTDLELVRGYYPFTGILGHEFVGVVERGPSELLGRRVVGEINAVCHECAACRAGRSNHCPNRTVLGIVGRHGAFAERLALPVENLHEVPDAVPDEVAVFTEPLAAALRIPEQIPLHAGNRVLVLGAGRLGQLIARALSLSGVSPEVVVRNAAKGALLERAGIGTVPAGTVDPGTYDVVVECTGHPDGFSAARRAVRPGGTLVLKSTYAARLTLDASALVVDEITLVGSRCGPFAPALARLADGTVDPRPLIHATYPLSKAPEAFGTSTERGVVKVLLRPSHREEG